MLLSRRQIVLLVMLTLLWGINWPVMKYSLRELTPLYFRALTMTGGCVFLAAWMFSQHITLKIRWQDFTQIFWLALPNVVGWHMFSILGVQELASGRAAILGFTMPIWTALLSVVVLGQRLNFRLWVSIVAAAAAVGLLSFNELTQMSGRPIGIIWMQIGAFFWGLGTVLFGRIKPKEIPVQTITVWMLAIGSSCFWLMAIFTEPPPAWHFSGHMWLALAYGIFINFGIAQLIWFSLASSLPPSASAFSIMAVPLVGIFSAAAIVHETPHLSDLVAAGCVMIAIASAVLRQTPEVLKNRKQNPPAHSQNPPPES